MPVIKDLLRRILETIYISLLLSMVLKVLALLADWFSQ